MNIGADRRRAAGNAEHEVGALGADAVQRGQRRKVAGQLAAVVLHDRAVGRVVRRAVVDHARRRTPQHVALGFQPVDLRIDDAQGCVASFVIARHIGAAEVGAQVKEIKGRKTVVSVQLYAAGQLCVRGEVIAIQMPDHMASAA